MEEKRLDSLVEGMGGGGYDLLLPNTLPSEKQCEKVWKLQLGLLDW